MLKNFKNTKSAKRAANVKMQRAKDMEIKKVHAPHGQSKEESPPSTDTEVSDSSSDSDYEEVLISSLRKSKPEPPVEPTQEPAAAAEPEVNHANHFQPEPAKPTQHAKPKRKSKRVVIKKYYQQRAQPPPETSSAARTDPPPQHASYIGLASAGSTYTASNMRSRLLNW